MNSPVLALDIGLKRTGIALSESGLIAQPLGTITWHQPHIHGFIDQVVQYLHKYEIGTLVIGSPLDSDEQPTSQSLKTDQLVSQLEERLQKEQLAVEIVRINEFHSTLDAARLFPNTDKDAAAATLLLQDYLEQHSSTW